MRKVKDVVVDLEGRDKGKRFRLTEMSAPQAEKWAIRATIALAHSGVQIPEEMLNAGWAALAYGALDALHRVKFEDLEPLLDEMMACVQRIELHPDTGAETLAHALMPEDIEEVVTRFWLRGQLFELHSGFSLAGALSRSAPAMPRSDRSPGARTSRPRSRQRLAVA